MPSEPTAVDSTVNIENYNSVPFDSQFDPLIPCTHPISVNDLGSYVACCHNDSNAGFGEQYEVMLKLYSVFLINLQELYTGKDKQCTVGFSEDNKPFNRFKDIAPCKKYN